MIYVGLFILAVIAANVFIVKTFALIIRFFNWLYPIIIMCGIAIWIVLSLDSLKPGDITNLINKTGDYVVEQVQYYEESKK
jgi:hypothetical protein